MSLHSPVINPEKLVVYNGIEIEVKAIQDRLAQCMYGYGHEPSEIRRRKVFPGYPHKPEECTQHNWGMDWDWINDGQNLVCPGCGLEGT